MRNERSANTISGLGAEPVRADLTDDEALKSALSDLSINVVFHLAAKIASQKRKARLREVNIEGTQKIYAAVIDTVRNGKNWWVVHVDDVTSALEAVMERESHGEIYHVCGGHPVTMSDFVAETARLADVKIPGNVSRWIANLTLGKDTVASVVALRKCLMRN